MPMCQSYQVQVWLEDEAIALSRFILKIDINLKIPISLWLVRILGSKVLEEAGTTENEIRIFRNVTESQPLFQSLLFQLQKTY